MDRGDGIFCRISTNVETRFLNQRDIKEKSLLFQFLLGSLPLSLSLARSLDRSTKHVLTWPVSLISLDQRSRREKTSI